MRNFRPAVSVCVAVYNGAEYISEQLESILTQLSSIDEVVIVDDCSSDSSVDIIESFHDARITLLRNTENIGHVKSFSKAISNSKLNYIFLCDQDDIWPSNRIELFFQNIPSKPRFLITGNSQFIDEMGRSIDFKVDGVIRSRSSKNYLNITKLVLGESSYFGCCMMFDRQFWQLADPISPVFEAHDQWLAILANTFRCNYHIDDVVLYRRIHGFNVSYKKRSNFAIFRTRMIQSYMITLAFSKYFKEQVNV